MAGTIREASRDDIALLAPSLRSADVDEVRAASGMDPEAALNLSYEFSDDPMTIEVNGMPIAMFGVCPVAECKFAGIPWLLGSDAILEHQVEFVRRSFKWLRGVNQNNYPLLFNYVDERNEASIKWLRWCGFKFIRRVPDYGFEKRPFFEFVRISNV